MKIKKGKFRNLINYSFNFEELFDLCIDLEVDYENFPRDRKKGVVRELVLYFDRRKDLERLIKKVREERPHTDWSEIYKVTEQFRLAFDFLIRRKVGQFKKNYSSFWMPVSPL